MKRLRCRECGRLRDFEPAYVCEHCFGPLEVAYDFEEVRERISRDSIARGPNTIWRYRELLPAPAGEPIDLGTGFTSLIRARNLGKELGLDHLYVKNDTVNPTGSFKDRNVAVATNFALSYGFDTLSCSSTGNLAGSVAAYAARAGMRAMVFIPAGLEPGKVGAASAYGATVVEVGGTYDDVNRLCVELADLYRWAIVNVNLRPFYSEGSKTLAFEVVEQLGWRAPDHIVVPVAAGSLLAKTAKAFQELLGAGLITEAPTRIHAAQAEGCAPVSTAIQQGADTITPVRPNSIAKSLAIGNPADGRYAARAVRASGGWATACREEAIQEGMALLAETEGILSEPAGGVVVAGLQELIAQGRIRREETVVICITGSGLKTTELFEARDGHRLQLVRARASDFVRALAEVEKAPAVVA
ncbi:MAG TPA: threonine synthase [Candidatus Angelobacter sp.]|nr:threonine synthase [Candidatus Angelobacter sp.]